MLLVMYQLVNVYKLQTTTHVFVINHNLPSYNLTMFITFYCLMIALTLDSRNLPYTCSRKQTCGMFRAELKKTTYF